MIAFEIGWIPHGWVKGEPLFVCKLNGSDVVATIEQMPRAYDESKNMVNSFIITVPNGSADDANSWLKWWRE